MIKKNIIRFLILAIILVGVDIPLLNISNQAKHFGKLINKIQGTPMKINKVGAFFSYFFITFALYYFIIRKNKSPGEAFLLGLAIYGVYEYTSYALISKWDFNTTIIDTLWGGLLFYICTHIYYFIQSRTNI
tara:strand:+ start:5974 stop:6369 length:396 start_codon:yes stop_codon:yes gene_type:complete